jgi:hypothetical protein
MGGLGQAEDGRCPQPGLVIARYVDRELYLANKARKPTFRRRQAVPLVSARFRREPVPGGSQVEADPYTGSIYDTSLIYTQEWCTRIACRQSMASMSGSRTNEKGQKVSTPLWPTLRIGSMQRRYF